MTRASLQAALRGVRRLSLDTSVLLAAADGRDPRKPCAQWLVDEVEAGRFECVISALSVVELLVRPVAAGLPQALATQGALRSFPHLSVEPLTFDLAVTAADVRAATRLRTPDAIIFATALAQRLDAIVHADDEFAKTKPYERSIKILHLGRFCP